MLIWKIEGDTSTATGSVPGFSYRATIETGNGSDVRVEGRRDASSFEVHTKRVGPCSSADAMRWASTVVSHFVTAPIEPPTRFEPYRLRIEEPERGCPRTYNIYADGPNGHARVYLDIERGDPPTMDGPGTVVKTLRKNTDLCVRLYKLTALT